MKAARTWRAGAAAAALVVLWVAPEAGAGATHDRWHYLPDSWQPGGAIAIIPERAVNAVTPVDGVDSDAQRHRVRSRAVRIAIDDLGAVDGQTVRTRLSGFRDGRLRWTRERCLPVRQRVAVSGLRRHDELTVRVVSDGEDWPLNSLGICTGHPVGGTIDLWS
jgi:hypothetical protein